MGAPDFDGFALVDWERSACLCDVGSAGYVLAVAVTSDGADTLWIVDDAELHAEHPRYGSADQLHEQLGPLSAALRERIWPTPRCGRPTKGTGRPCRIVVSGPGEACGLHSNRQAAP
ncbi:hypothetical protein HMPREF0591_0533 [Mycobacterium parascrofulaceum ATCC BAA-614]|uniref:Uncharacterized protein n=1 Tax=Mycobacterium parascrofulaceum ATCC BAA-614 TaxID=525368 RepID=D5P2Y9_9MYCO|nr:MULTISPECIES: hypothetical protein [Mycobacterium]EFG79556.1 hypothetical protein HMPREF0591_0533 [Mycobacterium parascrofulaceum ATCC BAA-614]OCB28399.1 hypothetical protein A9X02_03040 [Mycobacterium malmoense]